MKRLTLTPVLAALALLGGACGDRGTLGLSGDAGAEAGRADAAGQSDARGDGAAPVDALVPRDTLMPIDAGIPDGGYYGIPCGFGICTPGTHVCCVTGSAPVQQCIDNSTVGPHCDFGANCDGPEDCSGGSCCAPSGGIMQTYCASAGCPAGRAPCHRQADCHGAGELCCFSLEFGWEHSECMPGPYCPS
ncbi:MAG TPA: hypothetical protein VGQ83_01240 [Polyangia bacterium]|jgi:hypothetical protein